MEQAGAVVVPPTIELFLLPETIDVQGTKRKSFVFIYIVGDVMFVVVEFRFRVVADIPKVVEEILYVDADIFM